MMHPARTYILAAEPILDDPQQMRAKFKILNFFGRKSGFNAQQSTLTSPALALLAL
jgi:hypothetical protein